MIMLSWGVSDYMTLPNDEGVIFHVKGFKFQGWVKIVYNLGDDTFTIFYLSNEMEIMKIQTEVYIDILVSVIDEEVEKTQDYENDVVKSLIDKIK